MSKGYPCRTYYNVNPFIGVSIHETMMPLPVPPFTMPMPLPHLTFDVAQGLFLGAYLSVGHRKKVVSDHLLFLGRMSDAGLFVPHISYPPSWYNLLTTLFGSSMTIFGASSVSIGCHNVIFGNSDCDVSVTPFGSVPFSLNLACFEPYSAPTDMVVLWGSVYAGMSWKDMVSAVLTVAMQLGIEKLMKVGGEALSNKLNKLANARRAARAMYSAPHKTGMIEKIANNLRRAAGGDTVDAAYKSYLKKAAKCRGIANALNMSDDDVAKFVADHGEYSEELGELTSDFKKYTDPKNSSVIPGRHDTHAARGKLGGIRKRAQKEASDAVYAFAKEKGLGHMETPLADVAAKDALWKAKGGLTEEEAKASAEKWVRNEFDKAVGNVDDDMGVMAINEEVQEIVEKYGVSKDDAGFNALMHDGVFVSDIDKAANRAELAERTGLGPALRDLDEQTKKLATLTARSEAALKMEVRLTAKLAGWGVAVARVDLLYGGLRKRTLAHSLFGEMLHAGAASEQWESAGASASGDDYWYESSAGSSATSSGDEYTYVHTSSSS